MYKSRIKTLTESHRVLNVKIDDHEKHHPGVESQQVQEWKKQRLAYRDEIRRLERLQWEHDHERVSFDDDR